jgi:hypothetical protein
MYPPARVLPRPFRSILASFLERPDLPFADVIIETSIQTAFEEEGVSFADGEDAVYTPAITLWAFLSQVLFKDEQRSCVAAVARPRNWVADVNRPLSAERLKEVQRALVRGTPLGQETWRTRLAARPGLDLTLRPRGRPRKEA